MKRQSIINYLNRNATRVEHCGKSDNLPKYLINSLFGECLAYVGRHNVICALDTPRISNRLIGFCDISTGKELMGRISANILAVAREHGGEI